MTAMTVPEGAELVRFGDLENRGDWLLMELVDGKEVWSNAGDPAYKDTVLSLPVVVRRNPESVDLDNDAGRALVWFASSRHKPLAAKALVDDAPATVRAVFIAAGRAAEASQ